MTIEYLVEPNPITTPKSYKMTVKAKDVIDLKRMSELINAQNPTIPAETAAEVITRMSEIGLSVLADGNTFKIDNFMSMVPTMPGRLDLATDPIPNAESLPNIRIKPAPAFKQQLQQQATFSRQPFIEKAPSITQTIDTNSGEQGWIRDGLGFSIKGSNLGFDATDNDLGVWAIMADGTTQVKQELLSLNEPSRVIITPANITSSLPAASQVEITLLMKNRFTVNGQVRESSYAKRVRTINPTLNLFAVGTNQDPISVTGYGGSDYVAKMVAYLKQDNTLAMYMSVPGGEPEQSIDVAPTDTTVVFPNFDDNGFDVTCTINNYNLLYQNVVLYQREMKEIFNLTTPI